MSKIGPNWQKVVSNWSKIGLNTKIWSQLSLKLVSTRKVRPKATYFGRVYVPLFWSIFDTLDFGMLHMCTFLVADRFPEIAAAILQLPLNRAIVCHIVCFFTESALSVVFFFAENVISRHGGRLL